MGMLDAAHALASYALGFAHPGLPTANKPTPHQLHTNSTPTPTTLPHPTPMPHHICSAHAQGTLRLTYDDVKVGDEPLQQAPVTCGQQDLRTRILALTLQR